MELVVARSLSILCRYCTFLFFLQDEFLRSDLHKRHTKETNFNSRFVTSPVKVYVINTITTFTEVDELNKKISQLRKRTIFKIFNCHA